MFKPLIALTSLTLAPFAAAVGSARVTNNCNFAVTLWSVGGSISQGYTLAPRGGTYSEPFVVDPKSGGKALKITVDPNGLFTGKPETIFAYNLSGNLVYYDLSDVFGDAFAGRKLVEASANTACAAIVWPSGTPPGGSQVKSCDANADVTLTLCSA